MNGISQLLAIHPIPALAAAFAEADRELFVVGGTVRDLLLNQQQTDLDFTTNARPHQIKRLLSRAHADHIFAIGERFGTIGGVFGEHIVEVTTYRSEAYEVGSRKPQVEFGDSLDGDLSRRDFTINAMALHATTGDLVDPFGGQADLQARQVRAVGVPADRFRDDPLRLMRAVRFASRLAFEIEPIPVARHPARRRSAYHDQPGAHRAGVGEDSDESIARAGTADADRPRPDAAHHP